MKYHFEFIEQEVTAELTFGEEGGCQGCGQQPCYHCPADVVVATSTFSRQNGEEITDPMIVEALTQEFNAHHQEHAVEEFLKSQGEPDED